ncbi:MAG: hypothetical protein IJF64_02070, partial [Clostridia bacterium]|nr:hypothetical protein [Clostridia bacterium]
MKKLIKILALSLCIGTAATLTSCVELVHPKYFSYSLSEPALVIEYAEVGTTEDFVDAIKNGESVKLTENLELNAVLEIPAAKEVFIDLNGKNVTTVEEETGRHYYAFENKGSLTLTGNGTISARGIKNKGTMTVEDGVAIEAIDANGGAAIWNEGELHIKGGTFKALYAGSSDDEFGPGCLNNQSNASVTIDGGIFQSNNYRTYAIISSGEMTINDATVISKHGAVACSDGTTTINGGTFFAAVHYGLYVADGEATVNGGFFSGDQYKTDVYVDEDGKLTLNGGTLTNNHIWNKGTVTFETGSTLPVECVENIPNSNGTVTDNRVVPEEPETPEGGEGEPEGGEPEGGEG